MFEYIEDYQAYEVSVGYKESPEPRNVVVIAKSHTAAIAGAIEWFDGDASVGEVVPHSVKVLEWNPILVR